MTRLSDIITDLVVEGADRGAVVNHSAIPCVLVLMFDDPAIADLGSALRPIAKSLGSDPVLTAAGAIHDGRPPGSTLTDQTCVREIFDECARSPRHWLMFKLQYWEIQVLGLAFHGHKICREVADICNAHRCPCSLDPNRPAPGYAIAGTRKRKT